MAIAPSARFQIIERLARVLDPECAPTLIKNAARIVQLPLLDFGTASGFGHLGGLVVDFRPTSPPL
jgi:hypothetical protein